MTKILIGLTGRKGVGKSSFAEMLRNEMPGAEIVALADALKNDVAELVAASAFVVPPIGRAWLDAHKGSVFGPLLQGWGSLMREAISEDYWVDVLADEVRDLDTVIVPDVRYENEATWIHSQGGLLIAIDGPSRWARDERDTTHPSEAGVDKCRQVADIVIENDGSLEHLANEAYYVARHARAVPA